MKESTSDGDQLQYATRMTEFTRKENARRYHLKRAKRICSAPLESKNYL